MTTDEMINILETLYAQYPNASPGTKLIEVWYGAFGDLDAALVAKAVQRWMMKDTSGFPPVIGQIAMELRELVAPWLKLTYEEAKELNHPLFRKAQRLVYGKTPRETYNAYADPSTLLKTKDVPFKERDAKNAYVALLERMSDKPVKKLVEIDVRIKEVMAGEPQKQLGAA